MIKLLKLSIDSKGNVIADGVGEYGFSTKKTMIDVKIEIKSDNLQFEMWEICSNNCSEHTADGSHVG